VSQTTFKVFILQLDGPSFHRLFKIVTLAIANRFTNVRGAVTFLQHLSVTLRCLYSGSTEDLKFGRAVGPQFNRSVLETCLLLGRQTGTGWILLHCPQTIRCFYFILDNI